MPIRKKTIKEYGENFIVMKSTAAIKEAFQSLRAQNYQVNKTYLIFSQPSRSYQVALFSNLQNMVQETGLDQETPLDALPIPPASRVEPTNTQEGGAVIVDWVAMHPQSTLVVVEGNQVVGLMANPNRSEGGVFGWLSFFSGLHGETIPLKDEVRLKYGKQQCPSCGQIDFPRFDPARKEQVCRHCEAKL